MGESVLFVAAIGEGDEDALVVVAGTNANIDTCKLCGNLIVAMGIDPSLGTFHVICRNGRMVRGLFSYVGKSDGLFPLDRSKRVGVGLLGNVGRVFDGISRVADFPIALPVVLAMALSIAAYPGLP
jgi:hypothetical protein